MERIPQPIRKYPIGIQNFEDLRRQGYLYVDKTALIYQLVTTGKPYFLSRPRRFGKSLLLSTLKAYFEGKKELFEGLAIAELETEWRVHPVLHLSLNAEKYDSLDRLDKQVTNQLMAWEALYGCDAADWTYSIRFMNVIKAAYEQTGQQVVVLIDEYDKPLLESLHNKPLQDEFRKILVAFYSVLKDADPYLKLIFITGVTKFAQMSIFSTLNQLIDISLEEAYEDICGMTRREIEYTFSPELDAMAAKSGTPREVVLERMTAMYDGYHFCEEQTEGMYNPFSVLNALRQLKFSYYWFATGTPSFLVEVLRRTEFDVRLLLEGIEVSAAALSTYEADAEDPVPMLYQSGYLTIKGFEEEFSLYRLEFPNDEVKYGLLSYMTRYYTPVMEREMPFHIGKFVQELRAGEIDAFMTRMRAFFGGLSYELSDNTERHYHNVFYIVFTLLGQYAEVEVRSSHGRADMVVKNNDYIYVFEFKLNGTAEEALHQIDEKGYLIPYTADRRQLVKVGVDFDKETRNLGRWLIVPSCTKHSLA